MAKKKDGNVKETDAAASAVAQCPVFVFRADRAGHIHGLIRAQEAMPLMPAADAAELVATIREFELWMDAQPEPED